MYDRCSSLFQSILPRFKRFFDLDESRLDIQNDKSHTQVTVMLCISELYARNVLNLSIRLRQTHNTHFLILAFISSLREAYSRDYAMHNVVSVDELPLQ